MSQSALFVLIRGADRRYYFDPIGFQYLYRDLVWGPEAFEDWVIEADEIDDWDENAAGGVVIDFDARMLVWSGERGAITCPAVANVYQRLLDHAWPHFQVEYAARGMADLAIAADLPDAEGYCFEPGPRYESIVDAVGVSDEDFDEEELNDAAEKYNDDFDGEVEHDSKSLPSAALIRHPLDGDSSMADEPIHFFDDDDARAWVTLVDDRGDAYQIQVEQISTDLIEANVDLIQTIKRLPRSDVPKEAQVTEGMWIHVPKREVGVWGWPDIQLHLDAIERCWQGWTVRREGIGYQDQCGVGNETGTPLSDADAIGMIAPKILSIKQVVFQDMFGEIGAGIKSAALRATGCLTMVLCFPIVLFALISGDWRSAGITIAILVGIIVVIFKWVEQRVRRKFKTSFQLSPIQSKMKSERPNAAGPTDPIERRKRLDELLVDAGLPSLNQAEH